MNILVTVASKHGATADIGTHIAEVLRSSGFLVDQKDPSDVTSLAKYDAVVLGSAVYAGRWLASARKFIQKHEQELFLMPVWLFSSGPLDPKDAPKDKEYVRLEQSALDLKPIEHKIFSGKLDKSNLNLAEKAIIGVVKAEEGDYRDYDEIGKWAKLIAAHLN